jgi:hypothetical protein
VLLIPGFPRIKEWVYAGFTFDLIGALYSLVAIGIPLTSLWPQLLALALMTGSYLCFQVIYYSLFIKPTAQYGNPI